MRGSGLPCVVLLLGIVLSCGQARRHRVLTFFFDGVPPLEEATGDTASAAVAPADSPDEKGAGRPVIYAHPPFREGLCDACHDLPEERSFSGGTDLVLPVRELCPACHDAMSPESLREENDWVHGPVAAGACTGCHSPHQTTNPFLLKRPAGSELCGYCHRGTTLSSRPEHDGAERPSCLDCHDPHAGPSNLVQSRREG